MLGWLLNLGFAGSGSAPAAPVFTGTITDISLTYDSGSHNYDLSTYFTGATSYSIDPAVETGWTFNTSTGLLTIDTDDANTFGPFTVTGSNAGGSDSSNAFSVTVSVSEETYTGGFWYDFETIRERYREKERKRRKQEEEDKRIKDELDRQIAAENRRIEAETARLDELKRLRELAIQNKPLVLEMGPKVQKAFNRILVQTNYSALEALERELNRAREEEEFILMALSMVINETLH